MLCCSINLHTPSPSRVVSVDRALDCRFSRSFFSLCFDSTVISLEVCRRSWLHPLVYPFPSSSSPSYLPFHPPNSPMRAIFFISFCASLCVCIELAGTANTSAQLVLCILFGHRNSSPVHTTTPLPSPSAHYHLTPLISVNTSTTSVALSGAFFSSHFFPFLLLPCPFA